MDIGKAFTFPVDDEDWVKKLIIGAVLLIIPIVNFITFGYMIRVLRNVAEGQEKPLPEWDQWGDDFMKGLLAAVGWLVYALPIGIAYLLTFLVGLIGASSSRDGGGFVAVCGWVLSCLSWLWGLVISVVFPAAIAKFATEDELGSFFKFGEIFQFIRDNLKNYIMAVLVILAASIVASFGAIACIIGVFFTTFWATITSGHILGQLVRETGLGPAAPAVSYGDYTPPSPTVSGSEGEDV